MNTKIIKKNITIKKFIRVMKKLRKKGGEYTFQGTVNEKLVTLNGIDTHNKIFIVDGVKKGGTPDLDVDGWIHEQRHAVTTEIKPEEK